MVSSTEIVCTTARLPAGDNAVSVYVDTNLNKGKAAVAMTVKSEKLAQASQPAESSVNGGAEMVITGNGFVSGKTTVSLGDKDCPVTSVADFSQVCNSEL